jgi:putative membrane protein insertion efficiency factor
MRHLVTAARVVERCLARGAIGAVRLYQRFIGPLLPPVCRFQPSCSQYMIDAIRSKGLVVGIVKGSLRILRCNPLFPGGYDPVR